MSSALQNSNDRRTLKRRTDIVDVDNGEVCSDEENSCQIYGGSLNKQHTSHRLSSYSELNIKQSLKRERSANDNNDVVTSKKIRLSDIRAESVSPKRDSLLSCCDNPILSYQIVSKVDGKILCCDLKSKRNSMDGNRDVNPSKLNFLPSSPEGNKTNSKTPCSEKEELLGMKNNSDAKMNKQSCVRETTLVYRATSESNAVSLKSNAYKKRNSFNNVSEELQTMKQNFLLNPNSHENNRLKNCGEDSPIPTVNKSTKKTRSKSARDCKTESRKSERSQSARESVTEGKNVRTLVTTSLHRE